MINIENTMSEFSIQLHNATPHRADFLGNGKLYKVEVDPIFRNKEGEPLPIRAAEEEIESDRTLKFMAARALLELPVIEQNITGLQNDTVVCAQIEQVRASDPEKKHIIVVSRIAYAALKMAEIETEFTSDNHVGFAVPAGLVRDRQGKVLYADRLDQPRGQHDLPSWNDGAVANKRRDLQSQPPWFVMAHNQTPWRLVFPGSVAMDRAVTAQPHYAPPKPEDIIGYTTEGTPITRPELSHMLGESHEPGAYFVHPHLLATARSLGREDLVGRAFMPHQKRDDEGNLTEEVDALTVFSPKTLELLARETT